MPLHTRSRSLFVTALVLVMLALGLMPWMSSSALAATFTVTNASDSGAGSLRQAILDANANPGADIITFAPATNGSTIVLASALPALASGGALTIAGNGVANTTVSGNNAVGIFVVAAGANVTISGMTITGGAAGAGTGGGISNNGTLTVISSALRNNSATDGGGIYNGVASTLTVTNSSVSSNTAATGGGIFTFGGSVTLNNSTLNANSGATGGGMFINNATVTINNTIIANSTSGGGDCVRAVSTVTVQNSLVEDASCGVVSGVNSNLTGDPALGAGLAPSAGSIVIDAGSNALVPGGITTDLAGNARIQGARVDMGAFESGLTAPPTNTPTLTPTSTPTITPGGPTLTPTFTPTATPVNAPNTPTPKPRKSHPTATPEPLGRITGTVINLTTGAPVPGIKVQVGDAVVLSDENGNYDRSGLPAGDYPVQLLLDPGQGEPAQGVIVVILPPGETVVQHLALRTPLPAPASAAPVEPAGTPAIAAAPAPAEASPAPAPAELPKTSGAGDLGLLLLVLAAMLIAMGLLLRSRRA